jgi:hypothetical protein
MTEMGRLLVSVIGLAGFLAGVRITLLIHSRKLGTRIHDEVVQEELGGLILFYFWSEGCAQCGPQERQIVLAQQQLGKKSRQVEVRKIHAAAKTEGGSVGLGILTVPTTAVIGPLGQVIAVNPGLTSAARLVEQCTQALPPAEKSA